MRQLFDSLAPRYDAFNRYASLGMDASWRRAAIAALEPRNQDLILDVATGTGDLAFAAAAHAGAVVGCDFAAEMIALARHKANRRCAGRTASFHVGRAEALPYAGERFDGATSAFAMRNLLPDLEVVLAEILRVLKPAGKLVILEFSEPPLAPVRWGHGLYTRVAVPLIGRWIAGTAEPFRYLQRSIRAWDDPEAFARRLRTAGFAGVGFRRLALGTVALHWGSRPSGPM